MNSVVRSRLTSSQQNVFAYMVEYFERNDQLPTAKALAKRFGWASENSASSYWRSLEAGRLIERNEAGKWRFVRSDHGVDVPLSPSEWTHAINHGLVRTAP